MTSLSNSFLLWINALSPLHPGVGRGEGVSDLPIQRDSLEYPCIYSSSLKGALKSHLVIGGERKLAMRLFGDDETKSIGALNLLDAYLLIIPVRSLKGVVLGATSTFLIKRFLKYLNLFSEKKGGDRAEVELEFDGTDTYFLGNENDLNKYRVDNYIYINEVRLRVKRTDQYIDLIKELDIQILPYNHIVIIEDTLFKNQILPRSIITYFRVKLSGQSKTVESGPWSEEYLPPGTVLYCFAHRNPWSGSSEGISLDNEYTLFIGGDESIGKGLITIRVKQLGGSNESRGLNMVYKPT